MPVKETTITASIIKLLKTVPNSFVKKIHGGRMQGGGIPDIYFTCKWIEGHSVWFEVKRPGYEATELQLYTMKRLNNAGCTSIIVRSRADVLNWLIENEIVAKDKK